MKYSNLSLSEQSELDLNMLLNKWSSSGCKKDWSDAGAQKCRYWQFWKNWKISLLKNFHSLYLTPAQLMSCSPFLAISPTLNRYILFHEKYCHCVSFYISKTLTIEREKWIYLKFRMLAVQNITSGKANKYHNTF